MARPSRPEAEIDAASTEADVRDRRAACALVPVSRETEADFATYVAALRRWQQVKNLVAPSTLDRIWSRHIADSAQLLALAPQALRWVDLGSGAGFPGLVIAIMLKGRPGVEVALIESNARKCAFLREVVRDTAAPARVHAGRIDAVLPTLGPGIEVVTSRALAPLCDLIALSRSLLDCGAVGLFLTGAEAGDSAALPPDSTLAAEAIASRTQAGARILRVTARGPAGP